MIRNPWLTILYPSYWTIVFIDQIQMQTRQLSLNSHHGRRLGMWMDFNFWLWKMKSILIDSDSDQDGVGWLDGRGGGFKFGMNWNFVQLMLNIVHSWLLSFWIVNFFLPSMVTLFPTQWWLYFRLSDDSISQQWISFNKGDFISRRRDD